jgi:hypothetical protein
VTRLQWKLVLVHFLVVLVLTRSEVCTKRTIALEIVLMHPTIFLGDEAQVEACLSSFGDSANPDAR